MLFNSFEFLLAFLPVCLIGFFALSTASKSAAAGYLVVCSLAFYGWWDVRYVPLLAASILANFRFGVALARYARTSTGRRILMASISLNLGVLGFFKYVDFFITNTNAVSGWSVPLMHIALPLGISFFTFTQIAFLVDAYSGTVREYRFVHYALFVTYFPHLIAGPVLHHREMMPQFEREATYRARANNFIIGGSVFIIGLAKKTLIADNLAPYAGQLFDKPEVPTLLFAWGGVLAYTFQLYFDFSGYSDMAVGLSRLFGIKLPINFASPYKAGNITEFWRRWHMTLSRFLRDYLYIPLGGNRLGSLRRYVNLMVTMLLGGLWHGAGWNFVIWGALHGIFLCAHQLWRKLVHGAMPPLIGGAITFAVVAVAWVFFRAASMGDALVILRGLVGAHGVAIPDALANHLGLVHSHIAALGIQTVLGHGTSFLMTWAWVTLAAIIAFAAPNTQQIMWRFAPALPSDMQARALAPISFGLRPRWAIALGLLVTGCLLSISRPSEFLYFQF